MEQPPMTAVPPFAPWRVMVKTQAYEIDVMGPVPAIVMNWLEQLIELYSGKKLAQ
jgi:hypothetical protein